MDHTVVDQPLAFKGTSKIPRLDSTYQFSGIKKGPDHFENNGREKSRLLQLQANYQQKMLRDKEEKMVNIYNSTQQRSMNKVQKGTARDFFQERRKMAEQNMNISQMPSMQQHYRQTRGLPSYIESAAPAQQYSAQDQDLENRPVPYKKSYVGMMNRQQSHPGMKKMSAGRDRSNPLAPIERNNTHDSGGQAPIPRKPLLHGRPSSKESQKKYAQHDQFTPKSGPIPDISTQEESPLPSTSKLKKPSTTKPAGKKSDFQKWQEEQVLARAQRLQQFQQRRIPKKMDEDFHHSNESEDEGIEKDDNQYLIEEKQRKLMEEIAKRQADLQNFRREREQKEIEEKAENERRRKQEEERQRREKREREKREAERKRKEEAEERRHEEQEARRRKAELEQEKRIEEAMKREEQEQRKRGHRSRQPSQQDGYDEYPDAASFREPMPPSAPKPSTRRKPQAPPPHQRHDVGSSIDDTVLPQTSARDSGNVAFFLDAAKSSDAQPESRVRLVKCSNCGRKFAEDRIHKHKSACGNITKKRKVMDPSKMRVEGTDMAQFQGRSRAPAKPAKKNNWRKKHEEFIANIKYAKQIAQMEKDGVSVANLPAPPPSENPDYVQCPYCSRRFNESAAERHIPRCKDLKTKPAPMKIKRK